MQVNNLDPGLTTQSDSRLPEESGQSHKVRQLLTRSSAPAGSQAAADAARAAMLPDSFHHRLRVHPGQQLHDLPECGQVSGVWHCIIGSVRRTQQSSYVLIAIHCLLMLSVMLSHIIIHHSWRPSCVHTSGQCTALDHNPCQLARPIVLFCWALVLLH